MFTQNLNSSGLSKKTAVIVGSIILFLIVIAIIFDMTASEKQSGGMLAIAFGIPAIIIAFSSYSRKLKIQNTPTSKARSIAMGFVEIFGDVIPIDIMKSPLANKECVFYKCKIEELVKSRNSEHWAERKSIIKGNPFYLRDETGDVLVDPNGAEADVKQTFEYYTSSFIDLPKNIEAFSKSIDFNTGGFLGNRRLRFTEHAIIPSDKIYVWGTAKDNPHKEEGTSTQSIQDIMIGNGDMFFISINPENKILNKLNIISVAGFVLGPIFIAVGTFLMFA